MRKFLKMLLAVLFCTSALCIYDVYAYSTTSSNASGSMNESIQDSLSNIKSTALNTENATYSDEEVYLTAQLVHHEAHNQAYNGKVAVAEVVLNRVQSSLFPDKVNDVIFQNGQFSSLRRLKNINPTELELRIAYNVLNGSLRVLNDKDVMYFRNPKITSGISASTKKDWGNLEYATYIGEHAFYSQGLSEDDKKESIFDKLPSSLDISKLFTHKPNTSVAKSEEPVEHNITDTSEVEPSTNTNTECNLVETVAVAETATVDEIATVDDTVADNIAENIEPVLIETAAVDDTVTLDETVEVDEIATVDDTVADNIAENIEPVLIETAAVDDTVTLDETVAVDEIATVDDTVADNIAENMEPALMENVAVDETVAADETAAVDETVADNMEPALICENTIAEKETTVISEDPLDKEIEEFLKTYDANDPVSAARYQALLDQKAERERLLRLQEEERIANEKARQQAVLLDKMAVEKVQRENEEYLRATNAAISQVLLIQGQ
ncbi:MAG: cell wall hydrolase [Lachnospiraceae bacterium]|nr:cell wall hydrolase [Lachnospiraceae bacterium]